MSPACSTTLIPALVASVPLSFLVLLMIPPLSAGHHTITYQLTLPTIDYQWNMTEIVTVLPITATVAFSHQPGMLDLTWPQNAPNFTVEATSSLNPPDWQPANLPIHTIEGSYQVTVPMGTNTQFFRLHSH